MGNGGRGKPCLLLIVVVGLASNNNDATRPPIKMTQPKIAIKNADIGGAADIIQQSKIRHASGATRDKEDLASSSLLLSGLNKKY